MKTEFGSSDKVNFVSDEWEVNLRLDNIKMTPVELRDKCDRLHGLLQCLCWVVDTNDFKLYKRNPHHDLVIVIQEELEEISKALNG